MATRRPDPVDGVTSDLAANRVYFYGTQPRPGPGRLVCWLRLVRPTDGLASAAALTLAATALFHSGVCTVVCAQWSVHSVR